MENSILIESKPLTPEQAKVLLHILSQTQIQAGAAGDALSLRLSLERIASGYDVVNEVVK